VNKIAENGYTNKKNLHTCCKDRWFSRTGRSFVAAWCQEGRRASRSLANAGQRLVTQIEGQNLPFGGGWEFRLKNNGDSTSVTITENGEVYNPLFRFVSKFIMGHNANLRKYAGFLEESFRR
jgi:hypothetical protein